MLWSEASLLHKKLMKVVHRLDYLQQDKNSARVSGDRAVSQNYNHTNTKNEKSKEEKIVSWRLSNWRAGPEISSACSKNYFKVSLYSKQGVFTGEKYATWRKTAE